MDRINWLYTADKWCSLCKFLLKYNKCCGKQQSTSGRREYLSKACELWIWHFTLLILKCTWKVLFKSQTAPPTFSPTPIYILQSGAIGSLAGQFPWCKAVNRVVLKFAEKFAVCSELFVWIPFIKRVLECSVLLPGNCHCCAGLHL